MNSYAGPEELRPRVLAAIVLLEEIVNSPGFRGLVHGYRRYRHEENLDPTAIYNRLMTGHSDGQGDLAAGRVVKFDYSIVDGASGTTIGYRVEGTSNVFTYRERFEEMDVHDLVSHLGHEIMGHLAGGFGHPKLRWRGRSRSVPYKVDEFIEELLEQRQRAHADAGHAAAG
jgi:hypothetical protein